MERNVNGHPFRVSSFLPEIRREKRVFAEVYALTLLIHAIGLVTPLFFQIVIDKVILHQGYATLLVLGVGVTIAIAFDTLFLLIHDYLLLHVSPKIDLRISSAVFRHLLSLPIGFFERNQAGALTRDVQQDRTVRDFLTGRVFFSLTEVTALAVFLPVLVAYNATLTALVVGFSAMIALVSAGLAGPFRRRLTDLYAADGARQALLVETLHGIGTVKALGLEEAQQRLWEQRSAKALEGSREFHWLATKGRASTLLLEKLMTIGVIWVGALMVFDGRITVGQLVAFQMLAYRVTGPLLQFVSLIHAYQEAALSARRLGTILEAEAETRTTGLMPALQGAITFCDVTFRYDSNSPPAMDHVSFSIAPGTLVGVVGRSGSGKSTLARLVHGMLTPQEGAITIDGYDLRDVDRAHLRRNIGVVPQEAFLFHGTIRENISAGMPDCSFAAITWAAGQAGADEFIRNLPEGYDTLIQEGAVNLSGGQRQRLVIARSLLRNPSILIFDEATSALDLESEAAIQENMAEITCGRTTILITHRLASLEMADAILVLDRGQVVGFGSHEHLLTTCLAYWQLWTSQNRSALQIAAE